MNDDLQRAAAAIASMRESHELGDVPRFVEADLAFHEVLFEAADNAFLDYKAPSAQHYGYCVFGKVVDGKDVVDRIAGVPTGRSGMHENVPTEDVVITRAEEVA